MAVPLTLILPTSFATAHLILSQLPTIEVVIPALTGVVLQAL
jgi:hypothetical protein